MHSKAKCYEVSAPQAQPEATLRGEMRTPQQGLAARCHLNVCQ